jgi:hypothetical protein
MSCHVPGADEQNTQGAGGLSREGELLLFYVPCRRRRRRGDNYIRSNVIDF